MPKRYCPCQNEQPDPCPLCGATVDGNDRLHGVCQYPEQPTTDYGLRLVLTDKRTGEVI